MHEMHMQGSNIGDVYPILSALHCKLRFIRNMEGSRCGLLTRPIPTFITLYYLQRVSKSRR